MNLFKWVKQKVLKLWCKFSEETRESIVDKLSEILNYLGNAVLLAVPLTFILLPDFSIKNYLITVACVWILIPFIEEYYVWFREKWKDSLPK